MPNKVKKSNTQRIKDVLTSGKTITETYAVNKLNCSDGFLSKRVAEFRKNSMNIATVKNRNGETAYQLVNNN